MSGWVVRCEDYTTGPHRTQEAAQAALDRIEKAGHCPLDHEVVER